MKNLWKWFLYGLAVFLLVLCIALPLFSGWTLLPMGRVFYSMDGTHAWMMGGWGVLGWIGLVLRWLTPVVLIGLCIALGVWWLRNRKASPPVPTATCARCGKPVEAEWVACPYCGKKR
jgi:hypothetical protein